MNLKSGVGNWPKLHALCGRIGSPGNELLPELLNIRCYVRLGEEIL